MRFPYAGCAVAISLALATSATAAQPLYKTTFQDRELLNAVETSSLVKNGSKVTAWQLTIYTVPQWLELKNTFYQSTLTKFEIDCTAHTAARLSFMAKDLRGALVYLSDEKTAATVIPPKTTGAMLLDAACDNKYSSDKAYSFVDPLQAEKKYLARRAQQLNAGEK
jgi:hypothetical protein